MKAEDVTKIYEKSAWDSGTDDNISKITNTATGNTRVFCGEITN